MQDLLGIGTNRRESMIGTGIGLGLAGYRLNPPGVLPVLDLRFATDKSLTAFAGSTPSFSRASSGTYFDANGVLQSAAVNGPRFNHTFNGTSWVSRGLLVEEQRTNVIQRSEDFANAYWSTYSVNVSSNQATALDGATTADKLYDDSTSNEKVLYRSGTAYTGPITQSIFAKAAERSAVVLQLHTGTSAIRYSVVFDLSNGTVGATRSVNGGTGTYGIQNVGNGWYRCWISWTNNMDSFGTFHVALSDSASPSTWSASGFPQYTGNGSSGIYIWGIQGEAQSSFPTSYIGTTSSAVVRSADVCQITGGDFSGFWNGTEGTVAVEFDRIYNQTSGEKNAVWFAQNSASPGSITMGQELYNGSEYFLSQADVAFSATPPAAGITGKSATGYKVNDYAFSLNGASALTDTVCTVPTTVDRLVLGNQGGYSVYLNGHIARLRYYRTRLENGTLRVLST